MPHAARRAAGSKPVVGSSRKTSSGSPTSASARSSRRCWPPESLRARCSAAASQPDDRDDLLDVARARVEARPVRDRLAHREVLVDARALQHDADPRPQVGVARGGVVAEHGDVPGAAAAVALEDLDGRRLARPRWGRAGRTPRRGAPRSRCPAPPRARRRPCGGPAPRSRSRAHHGNIAWAECSAPASTSAPTRRACWSPTSRTGRLREVRPAARVHAHRQGPQGRRDPAREDRRGRRRGRRAARARRAAGLRRAARGRHRRDPRARPTAPSSRRRCAPTAASTSRCSTAPRRRGSRSSARRARSARRSTGRIGVVDVGGGSTELAIGTLAGGATWSESFRVGSGLLTDGYRRSDPPSAAELHAMREHAHGVFEGLALPPVDAAVAVGGSAASLRRLVGAVLDAESLQRALRVLVRRARRRRRAALLDRPRARAADARRADRARRRRARARAAAADRPRRSARRRPARARRRSGSIASEHPSKSRQGRRARPRGSRAVLQPRAVVAGVQPARARARRGPGRAAAGAAEVHRDRGQQPRRVLHGPRRRPPRPGRRRHRDAAAGRAHAARDARRDPRRGRRAHGAPGALPAGRAAPGARRARDPHRPRSTTSPTTSASASTSASGARSSRC